MSAQAAEVAAIASAGEAEQVIANLNTVMDRLEQTLAEETAQVRAGHLRAAAELEGARVSSPAVSTPRARGCAPPGP